MDVYYIFVIQKNAEKTIGALVEDILQNSHADTIIKVIIITPTRYVCI